ncbi:hypothetical protein DY000_02024344 [Brassica cretica]|uniref:Uncharacterized protein n=1 Tax=Brassica cretica TaxID=69181 RepID=A0ABQ7EL19_BRACR|nr:hypothetical protein DY000_02024344 [Brassica cretica]
MVASTIRRRDGTPEDSRPDQSGYFLEQGQRCCSRSQTPIQAEAEGLSWVMKEVWDRGSNNSCLNLTASS